MLKLLTIIGARPQIIKAAALSRAVKNHFPGKIKEVIVHTGQHYDENMSQVFFDELGIPSPDYNLGVGSGSHGKQTAAMISGIEDVLLKEKPHALVLYGDTNSTLAGAVAASKLHVPVVHIEAGLRSHNKSMPEEINRILCDHVSTLLFSPTKTGYNNLVKEGFSEKQETAADADHPRIYHCGDIMYDNSLYFSNDAETKTGVLKKNNLENKHFALVTIHRDNNTDNPSRLNAIFSAILSLSGKASMPFYIPLHPRTRKMLPVNLEKKLFENIENNPLIKIAAPASFLEMIALEKNALIVLTDSGGVQKEAFYFKKPCIILRPETEWVELVECGTALIADADETKIKNAFEHFTTDSIRSGLSYPAIFGDGHAAEFICREMMNHIKH